MKDDLDIEIIAGDEERLFLGKKDRLVVLDSVDSTNDEVKRRLESGAPEGLTVTADLQTKGKGRKGRSWSAPSGTGIAVSFLLKPEINPDLTSMITLVAGLSCVKAVRKISGTEALIKWPNDIVLKGKKLSGILTEFIPGRDGRGAVITGTGINVSTEGFPEELKETATSLYLETGKTFSRSELLALYLTEFERNYGIFLKDKDFSGLREEYESFLVNLGKEVRVLDPGGEFDGTAEGIDEKGSLLVRKKDKELVRVYAGEVSVRGIYGYC